MDINGPHDLTKEQWREYDWDGRVYRIFAPSELFIGKTSHRVVDATGIVHLCPAPGERGCVVRWQPKNAAEPVQF